MSTELTLSTALTPATEERIALVVKDNGLTPDSQASLMQIFGPLYAQALEWTDKGTDE